MAQRRGQGEGSIYKEGNGYRVAVSLGRDQITGKPRRAKRKARTLTEARRILRDLLAAADTGDVRQGQRQTLAAWLDHWCAKVLPGTVAPGTQRDYNDVVRLHLRPSLGHHRLDELGAQDVDQYLNAKRAGGLSANSVRIHRAVLRRALTDAQRVRLVTRNAAADSLPPRKDAAERRAMTVEQLGWVLSAARLHDGEPLAGIFELMAVYGLRAGEACGLRWDDVDVAEELIRVRRDVERYQSAPGQRSEIVVGELKTAKSRRDLPLVPRAVDVLERQRREQADLPAGDYVFSRGRGPLDPNWVSGRFRKRSKAVLGEPFKLHELRHTAATNLALAGVPLVVASRILGHSSVTVTADVYSHVSQEQMRDGLLHPLLHPDHQV